MNTTNTQAAASSPKGRLAARTALAATLGLDSRDLSEYSYKPGRFDRAIYVVGGWYWAVGPVPPKATFGDTSWEPAPDQFWAQKAGTVVWRQKEATATRTSRVS